MSAVAVYLLNVNHSMQGEHLQRDLGGNYGELGGILKRTLKILSYQPHLVKVWSKLGCRIH